MNKCINCGNESQGKYCQYCGQETYFKRLEVKTIFHDIFHGILHWENSILKTFRELFLRPGITARNYISGVRKSYIKPFSYFIFIQTVYVVIFHMMSGKFFAFMNFSLKNTATIQDKIEKLQHTINAYINYLNYLMPLFFALYFFLFFRKKLNVNYAEGIAASFYWIGTTLVFGILLMLLSYIDIRIWNARLIVNLLFLSFAIMQYSGEKNFKGIIKSFFIIILSYVSYALAVSAILLAYFMLS